MLISLSFKIGNEPSWISNCFVHSSYVELNFDLIRRYKNGSISINIPKPSELSVRSLVAILDTLVAVSAFTKCSREVFVCVCICAVLHDQIVFCPCLPPELRYSSLYRVLCIIQGARAMIQISIVTTMARNIRGLSALRVTLTDKRET